MLIKSKKFFKIKRISKGGIIDDTIDPHNRNQESAIRFLNYGKGVRKHMYNF